MDDAAIEQALRTFFGTQAPGVAAAYLFGSVARGTSGPTSDVDVAVLLERPPSAGLAGLPLDLEGDLERLLGVPAQVVVLNRAPVDLAHRILRDGKLLVDRNSSVRIAFEVRARNEFFDLKPVLDQYRAVRGSGR
nr:nucleotidyltransferase [uncultured bacterium]